MNEYLRLISGDELLLIDPTDGTETLSRASTVFAYVDSNFARWGCHLPGMQTPQAGVRVFEMTRDGRFSELFNSFGMNLRNLCLTQAQIINFVKRYPFWLKSGGNGTFFLLEAGSEFFIAAVYQFFDGRIGVRARRFSLERVFRANKGHRVIVPEKSNRRLA